MTYIKIPPPLSSDDFEERLVNRWGETVDKVKAGEMLGGIDRETVRQYVKRGYLQEAPNGRIIVRDAARWIKSNQRTPKQKQRLKSL